MDKMYVSDRLHKHVQGIQRCDVKWCSIAHVYGNGFHAQNQVYFEFLYKKLNYGIRAPEIQIIRTATLKDEQCRRDHVRQFHAENLKFPIVRKLARKPLPHMKELFSEKPPNVKII